MLATVERRYMRTPDGRIWTRMGKGYSYWRRHLEVFDQVRVAARVCDVEELGGDWARADGDGVVFEALPYYAGSVQYALRRSRVRRQLRSAVNRDDAVVMYAGGVISLLLEPFLRRTLHPYGVLVGGDPYDTFAPGGVKHPLRPILRRWLSYKLKRQCTGACAAIYVTSGALQSRYPCPGYSTAASDVELPNEALTESPRSYSGQGAVTLITVGSLEHLYKAPDVLIDAVAACCEQGLDLKLVFVGDGKHREELQAQAASRGIAQRVRFAGELTAGAGVRAELDRADVFVLPSRQEGLPRAMVEAMARALPCIGSTVGGIPELLPKEDMVPPNEAAALADTIRAVASSPRRTEEMSARNLERARDYLDTNLQRKRVEFDLRVKQKTLESLGRSE